MLKKVDTNKRKQSTRRKNIMKTRTLLAAAGIWATASLTLQAAITLDISGAPPVPPPTQIAASGHANKGLLSSLQGHSSGLGSQVYGYDVGGGETGPFGVSGMGVHTPVAGAPPAQETLTITHNGGAPANANYTVVRDRSAGAYLWNVGAYWDGTKTLAIANDLLTEGNGAGIPRNSGSQIFGVALPRARTVFAGAAALALLLFGATIHPRRSTVLHIGR